jgi:hypothetical protein
MSVLLAFMAAHVGEGPQNRNDAAAVNTVFGT